MDWDWSREWGIGAPGMAACRRTDGPTPRMQAALATRDVLGRVAVDSRKPMPGRRERVDEPVDAVS